MLKIMSTAQQLLFDDSPLEPVELLKLSKCFCTSELSFNSQIWKIVFMLRRQCLSMGPDVLQ
jgi:hypothetical protein